MKHYKVLFADLDGTLIDTISIATFKANELQLYAVRQRTTLGQEINDINNLINKIRNGI